MGMVEELKKIKRKAKFPLTERYIRIVKNPYLKMAVIHKCYCIKA